MTLRVPSENLLRIHGKKIHLLMKNVQFIFSILILAVSGTTRAAELKQTVSAPTANANRAEPDA